MGTYQEEPLWLCGDIEVHLGDDSKFYCIDYARVFPPERLPDDVYKNRFKIKI